MALTFIVAILFWSAIPLFNLGGLALYFIQIGLYLLLFMLALWGLSTERITLLINTQQILEALIFTFIGWLFFLLVTQLLGIAQLQEEILALRSMPAWKVGANILSTWLFVGLGEELLFRSYFLNAYFRHFAHGTDKRRTVVSILFVSAFFSIWHLPSRATWLISGEIEIVWFLVSFLALFVLGLGYAYLFIRSNNILLAGLVHGVSDFPLVGTHSQMTPIILVMAIGCVEITRLMNKKGSKTLQLG
ncbi:MAG: CPBP family intramembrane glutamic endopeptidase [Candidatus Brachytrichaceae bacterium NZ_4S206]